MSLHTEKHFEGKQLAAIQRGGSAWLLRNRAMVASWAAERGVSEQVEAALTADLAGQLPAVVPTVGLGDVTVIVPCHNYGCFLQECLDSIAASALQPSLVIVVDDASEVLVQSFRFKVSSCRFQIKWERVEFRSQAETCRHGFRDVSTKYCLWLDADDKLHHEYLGTAIAMLEADREAAICFPLLEAFGDRTGSTSGIDLAPDLLRWQDLESRNWCAASSVYRSDIVRQSLALKTERVPGCGCNDWITARTVLRAGPWHALKCPVPLLYRQHAGQCHTNDTFPIYKLQANIAKEIVTIVVAFSGRWSEWKQLRSWIQSQSWPRDQIRLMILNSTHTPLTVNMLGLSEWDGLGIQIERMDIGFPKLADAERRGRADIQEHVDSAVAGLYNRAVQMAQFEWLLFCEDDVIPQRPDAIAKLFQSVGPQVAAVSGVYQHRYETYAVAFGAPQNGKTWRGMDGPKIEYVTGTGFGCLLVRRSVLSRIGLSGDDRNAVWFDVNVGMRVARAGWRWILDRDVQCDHLAVVKKRNDDNDS